MTETFTETTTLHTPAWYSDKVREELELPAAPGDYKVTPGELDGHFS